jgi:hypothetical protein
MHPAQLSWRRVILQVWVVLLWTVRTTCPVGPYGLPCRSVPPVLLVRTACPVGPYRLPCRSVPPALSVCTACPVGPYRWPYWSVPPALAFQTCGNSSCCCLLSSLQSDISGRGQYSSRLVPSPSSTIRAGFFKHSMGARNRGGIGLAYRPSRLHRLEEFIPRLHKRLKIRALFYFLHTVHTDRSRGQILIS